MRKFILIGRSETGKTTLTQALKGEKIGVKLIRPNADGVRELAGILTGREGTTVTLDTDNGPVAFEVNAASSVQLCDDEDLFD